jgi:hypothetical protein
LAGTPRKSQPLELPESTDDLAVQCDKLITRLKSDCAQILAITPQHERIAAEIDAKRKHPRVRASMMAKNLVSGYDNLGRRAPDQQKR